jgi:Cd2+/Zn2+-exporting ATPase
LECQNQHPLARAILHHARARGIVPQRADEHRALGGRGVEGVVAGKEYWIGSHRLLHESGAETPEIHERATEMEDAGQSIVAVGTPEQVCGLIGIADGVREGVAETIAALKRVGIRQITMLTGDNPQTAEAVGRVVGIDRIRANLLPEDKLREVEMLRDEFRSVAMVGDGVNDAPAMAVSTLGIAMGAIGSDAAIEAADVALMSDDLSKLPWLIRHAHRTLAVVKQNICFALGLKLLFVVLTFAGAASLWMAIAADTGASLLVIFNGLRLLRA